MEDLLSKNIFEEYELNKLCPDYVPAIRMEMRRNLVRFTLRFLTSTSLQATTTTTQDHKFHTQCIQALD